MSVGDNVPVHERLRFWEERAKAFQNVLEMALPAITEKTLTLLLLREAIEKADEALGMTAEQRWRGRCEQLREAIGRAYPQLAAMTLGEMRDALGKIDRGGDGVQHGPGTVPPSAGGSGPHGNRA